MLKKLDYLIECFIYRTTWNETIQTSLSMTSFRCSEAFLYLEFLDNTPVLIYQKLLIFVGFIGFHSLDSHPTPPQTLAVTLRFIR